MNCSEIQEKLLALDDLSDASIPPEVSDHLRMCPQCARFTARLRHLEAAATELGPIDSKIARDAFLAILQSPSEESATSRSRRSWPIRIGWRSVAAAAVILLAIGSGIWMTTFATRQPALAADATVDRLLDWNLKIADTESPDARNNIFATQVNELKAQTDQAALPADQQQIASKLLENGLWLSSHPDPLAGAEHFDQVANLVLDQLNAAATRNQSKAVERLSKQYDRLTARGLRPQLKRAKFDRLEKPDRKKRYERLLNREDELNLRLQQILETSPNASKKEIRRLLNGRSPARSRPVQTQP
jgi:hypothetical protein